MPGQKSYDYTIVLCFVIPVLLIGFKIWKTPAIWERMMPREVFRIDYEFDVTGIEDQAKVRAYIPEGNLRQTVHLLGATGDSVNFQQAASPNGLQGIWNIRGRREAFITQSFEVEGRAIEFTLPENVPLQQEFSDSIASFLLPSDHIQSTHHKIVGLANVLKRGQLLPTLQSNFQFVAQIPTSNTGLLTDALTTLERNRASCNGKSRLFAAICRAQGIPARVIGGIIMEDVSKRTSHLWVEVFQAGHWIPFDLLNGHFAYLPAHYLELYKGDHFLISRTQEVLFDYQFDIKRQYRSELGSAASISGLWPLLSFKGISVPLLRSLLLLPLAALVIAILSNVVGLKTFGTLLPALIGLSLVNVDFLVGIITFAIVVIAVALIHFQLLKWRLLHVPQLVIMLTMVIMVLLGMALAGQALGWDMARFSVLLPIVVLSITAERFAKTLAEEELPDALKMLLHTFLVAFLCCLIFRSNLIIGYFLTFPESYIALLGILLLLGRWIGMRLMEYHRFSPLARLVATKPN
ncbi:MAG: hypothetical protein HRU41_40460 [Saprospiraceae bacterium]|nr:hypothetical protein [Saprospiraceae bacterium]